MRGLKYWNFLSVRGQEFTILSWQYIPLTHIDHDGDGDSDTHLSTSHTMSRSQFEYKLNTVKLRDRGVKAWEAVFQFLFLFTFHQ